MEKQLKKERNRLFVRIILIMLAVWLIISAVFCAVRLNIEKTNTQNQLLESLSTKKKMLSIGSVDYDIIGQAIIRNGDFLGGNNESGNFDNHLIVTDTRLSALIADTAKSIVVKFGISDGEYSPEIIGLINYDKLKNSLSGNQYKKIAKYLNTKRSDGNYYELICSKLRYSNLDIYPRELRIVLVDKEDKRFLIDKNVESFTLKDNTDSHGIVYKCSEVKRNTIPKNFLLKKEYNKDLISSLTIKQQKQLTCIKNTGMFEHIFYASDYFYFYLYPDDYNKKTSNQDNESWLVQYAKKVNLLDNCITDLELGVALAFVFLFIIAAILCIMIWRTVKAQIIGEQKRLDLTNALAHDIKTPLFVISGYAYSLQENIGEDERDNYLGKILEQTENIDNLVHKMLDLSKLDSYNLKLNKSEFDLYELADGVVKGFAAKREIKITKSGNNTIFADKELVKGALENLVGNAVKYSPENSVIEINVDGKSITISNPCEDLTKADLKDIMKPYVRKDKSRHQKGNGLGLSIVKSITDLHNAKFSIKCVDNKFVSKISFK